MTKETNQEVEEKAATNISRQEEDERLCREAHTQRDKKEPGNGRDTRRGKQGLFFPPFLESLHSIQS